MGVIFSVWMLVSGNGASSQPTLRVEAAYREPASAFEIIDNVSNWWPGYNEPEYRAFWETSFGIPETDAALFSKYKILREKYFDKSGQNNSDPKTNRSGLFTDSTTLVADPIAYAFYHSQSFEEAYKRLGRLLSPDEAAFLRSFFNNFASRLARLNAEFEKEITGSLARTRQVLEDPNVVAYLHKLTGFVGIDQEVHFTALYVWWPDTEKVRANPNGPFLLIRLKPHEGEKMNSADVIVHEAVHALLAAKADSRKKEMSDAILQSCPRVLDHTSRLRVIEEPIASILGNMEFRRRFDPKRFAWGRQWYGDQWVDLMARLLYPSVMEAIEKDQSLEQVVSKDAAALLRVGLNALYPNDP